MHEWGDEWFKKYGKQLYEAISLLYTQMNKYKIVYSNKEKWGTNRVECLYFYNNPFLEKLGILKYIHKFQKRMYNKIYQKVCKKYPDIIQELIVDDDYGYNLIKPCKWGDVDGEKIHNEYWKESNE